jgi:hypothetical protein
MKKPIALIVIFWMTLSCGVAADEPLLLRVENLAVLPNSQPLLHVRIHNSGKDPYSGEIRLNVPDSWRIDAKQRAVRLAAGESKRITFSINGGTEAAANSYPIQVMAVGGGKQITHAQSIVVASAPYFKPTIDGDPTDWKDAIPVEFTVAGKKTTIGTYWNRGKFSVLVAVEEDELVFATPDSPFDAVQFALSAADTQTDRSSSQTADRFEFLVVAKNSETAACHQLAKPETRLTDVAVERTLDNFAFEKADVAIFRRGHITYYECSVPFSEIRSTIRPSEGREFLFSVLVHDPDGTGLRDWGEAAGLWDSERDPLSWSRWVGAKWPDRPPTDCRTEWGMCSSRY